MKRVLITGLNSYIGNSFEEYIREMPDAAIETEKISLKEEGWEEESWTGYDTVLHVAGLAHVDVNHANEETKRRYYRINRDLAKRAAEKAKKDGVKQFIYLSSVIVYGDSAAIGKEKKIQKRRSRLRLTFTGTANYRGNRLFWRFRPEIFRTVSIYLY